MNLQNMIKKAQEKGDWDFANSVLYKLCSEHMEHKSNEVILAKIWLIGRSYAAAIERRKNNKYSINDDFYIDQVVPTMKKSKLDIEIKRCLSSKKLEKILELHKYLTDIFYDLTELNKRSLASKYLHFHMPALFYIYDSRVVSAIGKLNKELSIRNLSTDFSENIDKDYSVFYLKCEQIVEKIKIDYGVKLTCRQLDNLLIKIGNEKLK